MLEFILIIFILITSCGYLLAIMEIRKINHTTNLSIKHTTSKSTKTQVPITNSSTLSSSTLSSSTLSSSTLSSSTLSSSTLSSSTSSPLPKSTPPEQRLSFNRNKLFAGTFSDRHAITENALSKKNSTQLMMQQIIEGTSLDDTKSTGEISNSTSTIENKPSASASRQSTKRPKKMTFVADPDILKDASLLFDEDMDKLFQLNKTAKHKRQK